MKNFIYIALVLSVCTSGCDLVKSKTKKQPAVIKPSLKKVDDLDLAKILLKPKKADIQVSRDPFEPLVKAKKKKAITRIKKLDNQEMQQYRFLGVARVDNEYVAYLKNGPVKGTYRKDDKVKDFTITEIGPDEVILFNGDQTITLKRGASK